MGRAAKRRATGRAADVPSTAGRFSLPRSRRFRNILPPVGVQVFSWQKGHTKMAATKLSPRVPQQGDLDPILRELAWARRKQLDSALRGEIVASARYAEYARALQDRTAERRTPTVRAP